MAERILAHTGRNGYFVVDLQTGATISSIKGSSGRKFSSAFVGASPLTSHINSNTSYFAVADATRAFLHVFRTDKPDSPCQSHAVPEKLPCICFSPCGTLCIAGGETGNIYIWDVSTGALLRCWRGHYKAVTAILTSSDGGYLFTSGGDSLVCCYNTSDVLDARGAKINEDPQRVQRWSTHRAPITAMALGCMDQQGVLLLTGSADRVVHVWRPEVESPIATYLLPSEIRHIATNPTSMNSYICCGDGKIHVLNLGVLIDQSRSALRYGVACPVDIAVTPAPTFVGHSGAVECCTTNADGSILVSCGSDGVRIWDAQSRQTTKHLASLGDTLVGVSVFRDELIPLHHRSSRPSSHRNASVMDDSASSTGIDFERIPCPPSKAFQRTWTNVAYPPSVICMSHDSMYEQSFSQYFPTQDLMAKGSDSIEEIEVQTCDSLFDYVDTIEANSSERTVATLKGDRSRFNAALCDMIDTVCQLPSLFSSNQNDYSGSENQQKDSFYECALPETPIPPSEVRTHPHSIFPSHGQYPSNIPSQARRLFQYVDRSFARSSTNATVTTTTNVRDPNNTDPKCLRVPNVPSKDNGVDSRVRRTAPEEEELTSDSSSSESNEEETVSENGAEMSDEDVDEEMEVVAENDEDGGNDDSDENEESGKEEKNGIEMLTTPTTSDVDDDQDDGDEKKLLENGVEEEGPLTVNGEGKQRKGIDFAVESCPTTTGVLVAAEQPLEKHAVGNPSTRDAADSEQDGGKESGSNQQSVKRRRLLVSSPSPLHHLSESEESCPPFLVEVGGSPHQPLRVSNAKSLVDSSPRQKRQVKNSRKRYWTSDEGVEQDGGTTSQQPHQSIQQSSSSSSSQTTKNENGHSHDSSHTNHHSMHQSTSPGSVSTREPSVDSYPSAEASIIHKDANAVNHVDSHTSDGINHSNGDNTNRHAAQTDQHFHSLSSLSSLSSSTFQLHSSLPSPPGSQSSRSTISCHSVPFSRRLNRMKRFSKVLRRQKYHQYSS